MTTDFLNKALIALTVWLLILIGISAYVFAPLTGWLFWLVVVVGYVFLKFKPSVSELDWYSVVLSSLFIALGLMHLHLAIFITGWFHYNLSIFGCIQLVAAIILLVGRLLTRNQSSE